MSVQELTCINCPMGCTVTVELDGNKIVSVKGNTCKLGAQYAKKEVVSPERMVTTTVPVVKGVYPMVSVKTSRAIPKSRIFDCIQALRGIFVQAPVKIGDVILPCVAGTDIEVIATRNVEAVE